MPEETTNVAETVTPVLEAAVDVKALQDQIEAIKRAQAGSDKAYQEAARKAAELTAENEKLKKEKMSEKEKAEYDFARQKAELEAKSREVQEATLRLSKMKLLGEKNLPADFAGFVSGSNEAEMLQSVDTIIRLITSEAEKRVNEKLVGSKKPEAGDTQPKLDTGNMSLKDIERLAREHKL
jgi:DNA repair exonuclease SbcCD ATPase subunit